MKKVDTHVHTCEVSRCGHVPGAEMARLYIQAGYDAILITDHFILPEVAESGKTPEETVEAQMRGYRAALEGAGDKLQVFLGAEIRFFGGEEDFLLVGLNAEKYLAIARAMPRTPGACRTLAETMGVLLYQAHPYRKGQHPAAPSDLSGVEVLNAHPRHDSHNDLALAYAQQHGLRMLCGSDAHQTMDVGRGGILAPDWVNNAEDLAAYLRDTPRPQFLFSGAPQA